MYPPSLPKPEPIEAITPASRHNNNNNSRRLTSASQASEAQGHRHLNLPRALGAADRPEPAGPLSGVGIVEIHVVQSVEEFTAQLEVEPLGNNHSLRQCAVDVKEVRAKHDALAAVAE